jgi:hypothetical protein
MEERILEELKAAHHALVNAKEYDLEAEVFVWSLIHLKENPGLTIEEAIEKGHDEWIK